MDLVSPMSSPVRKVQRSLVRDLAFGDVGETLGQHFHLVADDLDEFAGAAEYLCKVGGKDRAVRITDNVRRNDGILGVPKNALELAFAGCLHGRVDGLDRRSAGQCTRLVAPGPQES